LNQDDAGHLHFRILVWGPFASGKSTMVKWFYNNSGELSKGGLTSVENNQGQTVYFDYASLSTGGGVFYDFFAVGGSDGCTRERRILAEGSDAIIFVADSQRDQMSNNTKSLEELSTTLGEAYWKAPKIFVLNKRDLGGDLISSSELSELPNVKGNKVSECVATNGEGVQQAFQDLMVDVVQRTLTIQEIPHAPPELARMGIALITEAEGFEPTLEATYPRVFSIGMKEMKTVAGMHPPDENLPSFASVKTDDFYLCSYHTSKRDEFGASYIISLAVPADTLPRRVVSLFRRFSDSAPIILGQKNLIALDDLKGSMEQLYVVGRDHITSTAKARVEAFIQNPRDTFKDRLLIGGATDTIGKNVGYIGLTHYKNLYELVYAPSGLNAMYSTITPIDDYAIKTMSKDVERLRNNLENRMKTVTAQDIKRKLIQGFLDEMRNAGKTLLNTMLSRSLMSKIVSDAPQHLALEVDRDLLIVPLELLHDGVDFLCLRRSISRWTTEETGSMIVDEKAKPIPRVRGNDEPFTILIIDSRVEKELTSPGNYGEQIEKFLSEDKSFGNMTVKVDKLSGFLNRDEVSGYLSSGKYDAVHIIGSALLSSGDPTASSWLFQNGEIRGSELKALFANGLPQLILSYVWSPPWERKWDGKQQDRIIYTFAASTKLAGSDCFMGAVTDGFTESMMTFTKFLYEEILKNRKPVGEALKEARLRLIKAIGIEDDSWMRPVLYGNPAKIIAQESADTGNRQKQEEPPEVS
jgi:signal recognition particle receptor subunit beta/CHAT domain-containing protein